MARAKPILLVNQPIGPTRAVVHSNGILGAEINLNLDVRNTRIGHSDMGYIAPSIPCYMRFVKIFDVYAAYLVVVCRPNYVGNRDNIIGKDAVLGQNHAALFFQRVKGGRVGIAIDMEKLLKHGRYRYIGGGHGELIGAARALEVGRRVGYSVAVGVLHR